MDTRRIREVYDTLVPDFREKVEAVLKLCSKCGYTLVPYCGARSCEEQAKLWRQGQTTKSVRHKLEWLRDEGAHFIADCIDFVGPQPTKPKVTDAIPGLSYHQWGLAVDSVAIIEGEACWAPMDMSYQHYARFADELGLDAGYYWSSRDAVHIQAQKGRVLDSYSIQEVDEKMRERWGN